MALPRFVSPILAIAAVSAPAGAQTICGERAAIVAELERRYGETRRSADLRAGSGLLEVWASERTGTWTVLLTDPAGRTCLLAAGDGFEPGGRASADIPI